MENKYIKNVYTDKANNFCQKSFYPVEYLDYKVSTNKEEPEHVRKPIKKDHNRGKQVFSSRDIEE